MTEQRLEEKKTEIGRKKRNVNTISLSGTGAWNGMKRGEEESGIETTNGVNEDQNIEPQFILPIAHVPPEEGEPEEEYQLDDPRVDWRFGLLGPRWSLQSTGITTQKFCGQASL